MSARADCCVWTFMVTLGACIVIGAFFLGLLGKRTGQLGELYMTLAQQRATWCGWSTLRRPVPVIGRTMHSIGHQLVHLWLCNVSLVLQRGSSQLCVATE